MAKRSFSFLLHSLFASARGAVRYIWLSILVPLVLFYSPRGSGLLRRPVLTARKGHYIHADLNQASRIVGCTEMTIRVKVRMEPNPRRHYTARLIQTSGGRYFGSAIAVHETNKIAA